MTRRSGTNASTPARPRPVHPSDDENRRDRTRPRARERASERTRSTRDDRTRRREKNKPVNDAVRDDEGDDDDGDDDETDDDGQSIDRSRRARLNLTRLTDDDDDDDDGAQGDRAHSGWTVWESNRGQVLGGAARDARGARGEGRPRVVGGDSVEDGRDATTRVNRRGGRRGWMIGRAVTVDGWMTDARTFSRCVVLR